MARHPVKRTHREAERPPFERVALVLQGGGALGAYQAGVYQALLEAGIEPDWVAGISIGAVNSAIIAGNPPEARVARLLGFWEAITSDFAGVSAEIPLPPWLDGDVTRSLLKYFGDQATARLAGENRGCGVPPQAPSTAGGLRRDAGGATGGHLL